MKATKKIVCLTLAIVMAGLAFVMPVSAAKTLPLVIVNGIGSTPLYKDVDTADEALVFSGDEAFVEGMITDVGGAFVTSLINFGVANKDYNKFADSFFPAVNKYVEDIGYNLDGTPVNETVGFKPNLKPMSEYTEDEKAILSEFAFAYAEEYGEENVYNFCYDWREDPIVIAEELADFIDTVSPNGKVNLVAMSMGSTIALSYLAQYGGSRLNNVVFAAPAWQGTSLLGNVVIDNLEIDIFTVENYLVQLANVSATTHITAFIISFISSQKGLSHEYFGDINAVFQNINPRVYTDTFIPYFAGMPGIWSLVPYEDYEAGKKFIFENHGIEIDAAYEAKIDAYHEIQGNAKQIVKDAMADGMKFSIVCGYNCQMIPLSDEYVSSDTVIDTALMSGGATCAKYLQAHDDWGKVHSQIIKDGHNHISWDSKVDASTAMFPEQTWFIKNMQHNGFDRELGTLDVVMWLLGADEQPTVTTDKANYPQFFLYNTYKRTTKAMPYDDILGDVDGSGSVNTIDARLALKIAAGQVKPTDTQLLLGDIDEDGAIATTDAADILRLAAGIYI